MQARAPGSARRSSIWRSFPRWDRATDFPRSWVVARPPSCSCLERGSTPRALKSAPVDVTLIDRRNHHIFQPLLYQVATGSLAAGEVAAPLRSIFRRQKNARVLLGEVVDFDPAARNVVLADGAAFPYDALIVAAGTQ